MVLTEKYLKIIGTHILVAVGRKPNTNCLQLDRAGVELNPNMGIIINKFLRTSQKRIYAAGDCVGGLQFTHLAGFQGVIATRNALLPGNAKGIPDSVPWATFTQPEVAHV
jgi:pyruvate/2-oxoglutarate dehydrogenase complex dihydrolipoamide dehydrogenase (E3) component